MNARSYGTVHCGQRQAQGISALGRLRSRPGSPGSSARWPAPREPPRASHCRARGNADLMGPRRGRECRLSPLRLLHLAGTSAYHRTRTSVRKGICIAAGLRAAASFGQSFRFAGRGPDAKADDRSESGRGHPSAMRVWVCRRWSASRRKMRPAPCRAGRRDPTASLSPLLCTPPAPSLADQMTAVPGVSSRRRKFGACPVPAESAGALTIEPAWLPRAPHTPLGRPYAASLRGLTAKDMIRRYFTYDARYSRLRHARWPGPTQRPSAG
jgi:hypothetical protein